MNLVDFTVFRPPLPFRSKTSKNAPTKRLSPQGPDTPMASRAQRPAPSAWRRTAGRRVESKTVVLGESVEEECVFGGKQLRIRGSGGTRTRCDVSFLMFVGIWAEESKKGGGIECMWGVSRPASRSVG